MAVASTATKVSKDAAPVGEMGQKYLAAGTAVALRMWDKESAGEPKHGAARDYETVGYVISGKAELEVDGHKVTLVPGDSWVVPKGHKHSYRVIETFTAVEATSPPARSGGKDKA